MRHNKYILYKVGVALLLFYLNIFGGHHYSGIYEPTFTLDSKNIRKIGLLLPNFQSVKVFPGNIQEYRTDWSIKAQRNVSQGISEYLSKHNYSVVPIKTGSSSTEKELLEIFKIVSFSIMKREYFTERSDNQNRKFTYGVGSLENYFEQNDIDLLMYVTGFDETLSKDFMKHKRVRHVMKAIKHTFVTFLVLGEISPLVYREGTTSLLSFILMNKNGDVVYYCHLMKNGEDDFCKYSHVQEFMKTLFYSFPSCK